MQLLLSSTTVPDASVTALCEAAWDRGMQGLELVVRPTIEEGLDPGCEVHGCETDGPTLDDGAFSISWVLMEGTASVAEVLYWSRQAALLDAGLLLRNMVPESPLGGPVALMHGPVALMHGTDRQAAQQATAWARMHNATTCWEVQLGAVGELDVDDVLDVTGVTLAHVRLLGAGPESGTASRCVVQGTGPPRLFRNGCTGPLWRGFRGRLAPVALRPARVGVQHRCQEEGRAGRRILLRLSLQLDPGTCSHEARLVTAEPTSPSLLTGLRVNLSRAIAR